MSWSGLAKFLIGFSLAIAILIGGGAVAGMYFFNKFTVVPPKPIFNNDTLKVKRGFTSTAAKAKRVTLTAKSTTPRPNPGISPQPLEPGAYKARVNWSEGLLLRSGPTPDAERVGGVGYNQTVVVLQESPDKTWQRIRVEGSTEEGWIKSGNVDRVEAQQ